MDAVRVELAEGDSRTQLDDAFTRFSEEQPVLAAFARDRLSRPLDETALALGYFLCVAVWLAFERTHQNHLSEVTEEELAAARQALELDEELRRSDPQDALDTDDVISGEQPALVRFLHDHIDATLELHAESIDVDDVHEIYRSVLLQVLALSYGVQLPDGYPVGKSELLA